MVHQKYTKLIFLFQILDNNEYVNTTTGGSNSKNSNFPKTTLAQQLPPEVPPRQRGLISPKRTSTPQNVYESKLR